MEASKRIGVLMGGLSAERDTSVRAGEAVVAALRDGGHDAAPIFVDRYIDIALRQAQIDVAFLALRGRYGGDGCIQGLLEHMGIPYTGSGVLASGLAMNRGKAREVLRLHNLPIAPHYLARADAPEPLRETHGAFGFPVLVRPSGARSPLGASLAQDELELEAAVEDALRFDDEVLVERTVEGRTVAIGVLNGVALGAAEVPAPGVPTAMRAAAGTRAEVVLPARISPARYRSILRLGMLAYEALGCDGAACIEMVVSERMNEVVVDVDTTPLLAPTAVLPRIAQGAGLKYADLLEELLKSARLRAHGHRHNRRATQVEFAGPDRRASAASIAH